MTDALKCTKVVKYDDGKDAEGNWRVYHQQCGAPASEVEIGGALTRVKAILCSRHAKMADREAYLSVNGYPKGKIEKEGYQQDRLPGTGVIH